MIKEIAMETVKYDSYEQAAQEYIREFIALRQSPPAPQVASRGAGDIPAEILINRADAIADISAGMNILATVYIESSDAAVREGISGHLVAQAAAELQVALELLQVVEEEKGRPAPATRAARGVQLREVIGGLEKAMSIPVEQGLPSARAKKRAAARPTNRKEATDALEQSAVVTMGAITQRVLELGVDIAKDLVLQTEWSIAVTGVTFLGKDIAEKLEAVKKGAGALVSRAVTTAAKTLLNVYDKFLALLGKDVQDLARQKIQEWLEKMSEEKRVDLFNALMTRLYGIDAFKHELRGWLGETNAEVDTLIQSKDGVDVLGGKFATLAGRLAALETTVVLAKLLKIPQLLVIIAGIQVLLLAVIVYAGLDYVGYREVRFPKLTKGVAEIIREGLGIAYPS